ncbi:hypothetical protein SASPL_154499 [Salvia splendens]|uniref:Plant disease resistance WDH domain-containing protein n=1 Tax=Salvia splendens TaxID=180675 RepID=A0A8X8YZD1_SALSN|nr:hypothetical protein SASPL_154499 [Salvia splendens]
MDAAAQISTVDLTIKIASSPYSSAPVSPLSSAFVSALQSPYISPRAAVSDDAATTATLSYSGSQSDDLPSTSYTPPPEKLKLVSSLPESAPPRISFSFPIPRISFASPAGANSKLRSCDVYIGFHGQSPSLLRFCRWLKSELELQGIAAFTADRAAYSDNQSHEIADRVICSVTFGVILKKNLIPLFFDTGAEETASLFSAHADGNKECKEALDGLMRCNEFRLETSEGSWRSCVSRAVAILRGKLGRKSVVEREIDVCEELPFQRNKFFVGREREVLEIESAFFGCLEQECGSRVSNKLLSMDVGRCQEPNLEAWVEVEPTVKRATKHRKSKGGQRCVHNRASGSWEDRGGFGVCLSLLAEEQEMEAFKRVKRELFRDLPYLLIIDNLETEREWWEGKDLHDLIPRNTGGTHVIITTRLPRVMSFDTVLLKTLPLPDAMALVRGRRRREFLAGEVEFLDKFAERLGRSSFGLWVVGCLVSELGILPSNLFEAMNEVEHEEVNGGSGLSSEEQQFCRTSPFLMKVLSFCATVLQQSKGDRNVLASRMLQVGAWFAPSPVPVNLLTAAANNTECKTNTLRKWTRCLKLALCCCSGCVSSQTWKGEEESALLLVRLGLAWKVNRQPGCWIQFHAITRTFARWKYGLGAAKATVQGVRKLGNPLATSDHLWASAFLVFGFKSEPPLVQLKAIDMVLFIKRTALPLAIGAFSTFSRCNSALELLKVCTNMLEEVEKSFVSQIQDWCHGSLCWKKALQSNQRVDEYMWQEVTLLKATLLEMRARLLLRGGQFDSGEELCRTCISIRTVMLGHNHAQTLAAQETLAKLVRMRSKI